MISFPWDSVVERMQDGYPIYDRAYTAQQWWDIYKTFFSDGVFLNEKDSLQVTANTGMTVKVAPGNANIGGCFATERSTRVLEITEASSQDRIDTVVLRWNANVEARSIDLYVVQGIAQASPVRPELTRTETIYELGLCDIFIPKNATTIDQTRMTDTRLETARCGVVNPFSVIDTSSFNEQLQKAFNDLKSTMDSQTKKAVDLAQSALDQTLAGNLQSQIDSINDYTTGINLIRGSRDLIIGTNIADYEAQSGTKSSLYDDGFRFYTTGNGSITSKKDTNGFSVATLKCDSGSLASLRSSVVVFDKVESSDSFTISFEKKDIENTITGSNRILYLRIYDSDKKEVPGTFKSVAISSCEKSENINGWDLYTYIWEPGVSVENVYVEFSIEITTNAVIDVRKPMLQVGDIHNPIWSPSPFDTNYINDETTGLNLVKGTRDIVKGSVKAGNVSTNINKDGFFVSVATESIMTKSVDEEGFTFYTLSQSGVTGDSNRGLFTSAIPVVGGSNEEFTISFEFKINEKPDSNILCRLIEYRNDSSDAIYSTNLSYEKFGFDFNNIELNTWYKAIYYHKITNSKVDYFSFSAGHMMRNGSVSTRKIMTQRGHINNPIWAPNPFDIVPIESGGTGTGTGIPRKTELVAGTDLNEILDEGFYFTNSGNNATSMVNCPATTPFVMIVLRTQEATQTSGQVVQIVYSTLSDRGVWVRTATNKDSVTPWNKFFYKENVLNAVYPIGAVYISYNATSPASLFGGTWTQITGRFLRAANDVNTGGNDNVTQTTAQMPSHTHQTYVNTFTGSKTSSGDTHYAIAGNSYKNNSYVSETTGSGNSFSVMPAYQDLYVWRRTA